MFTEKSRTPEIVYVIDDDEAMRDSLQWLLEGKGYSVRCHENADRFLQALQNTDQSSTASHSGPKWKMALRQTAWTFQIAAARSACSG